MLEKRSSHIFPPPRKAWTDSATALIEIGATALVEIGGHLGVAESLDGDTYIKKTFQKLEPNLKTRKIKKELDVPPAYF